MRTFVLVLAAFAASKAAGADLRTTYGIELVDGGSAAEVWTQDEQRLVGEVLAQLPKELGAVALQAPFGAVRVFKNLEQTSGRPDHSAFPLFSWQLRLDLSDGAAIAKGDYPTYFKRRLVHHLLHAFDARHDVSESTKWRALSGWRPRQYFGVTLPFSMHEAANQDPRGYGTDQGLWGPEEDFATFGELFFVTPDTTVEDSIACRTPDKFNFYRQLFPEYVPLLADQRLKCRGLGEGFLDDVAFLDPITRQPVDLGPINPETVDGFELLYATPGVSDAAEVAGHLLLRIRLKNGPKAPIHGIDSPYDIVVSFLADTEGPQSAEGVGEATPPRDDSAPRECQHTWVEGLFGAAAGRNAQRGDFDAIRSILQALKGLAGGFLTTFDRQSLYQAVKTYTIDQDRNLLRYRLQLTEEQKSALLERLYLAKKNFKTKYYFFDRNCASILVQIIGEGIKDEAVANFDPFVVPPNALVELMIRRNLASPVHPAFYGYRKRGQVAQEELKDRAAALAKTHGGLKWPSPDLLVTPSSRERVKAWRVILDLAKAHTELHRSLHELASLGQDGELVFLDKTGRCVEASTPAMAVQRDIMSYIAAAEPPGERPSIDVNQVIYARYQTTEEEISVAGSDHTHLGAIRAGIGARKAGDSSEGVVAVAAALHRQDLGSITSQSMQRATSVVLGAAEVTASVAGENAGSAAPVLRSWRLVGLNIRKLKERLDQVPAYHEDFGALGLGLTVLDVRSVPAHRFTRSTWAGGELVANLASSRLYDRFLYASIGAALETTWGQPVSADGADHAVMGPTRFVLPVRVEALWTVGAGRAWQLRAEAEVRPSRVGDVFSKETRAGASLSHRWWQPRGTELLLRTGASWLRDDELIAVGGSSSTQVDFGLEWIPW